MWQSTYCAASLCAHRNMKNAGKKNLNTAVCQHLSEQDKGMHMLHFQRSHPCVCKLTMNCVCTRTQKI